MEHKDKTETIIVDGSAHEWPKHAEISYDQVVTLEVPDYPQHPDTSYSVKYKNGPGHNHEGFLVPGSSVKTKEGMVFCVSHTGQS